MLSLLISAVFQQKADALASAAAEIEKASDSLNPLRAKRRAIERAMAAAVETAHADGIEDPVVIRQRMFEARDLAKRQFAIE